MKTALLALLATSFCAIQASEKSTISTTVLIKRSMDDRPDTTVTCKFNEKNTGPEIRKFLLSYLKNKRNINANSISLMLQHPNGILDNVTHKKENIPAIIESYPANERPTLLAQLIGEW